MRNLVLLMLVMFVMSGCATFKGMRDGFKEDTHNFFGKAHDGVMKADAKFKEKAW